MLDSGPTGCTSFEAAFERIQEYIGRQAMHSAINVVFMTDGEDTSSRALSESQKMFKVFLANCRRQVVVHTLSFGRQHNRSFLQELSQMGSSPGCYRYAETADKLDDSFAQMFDFLMQNVKLSLRVGSLVLDVDAAKEAADEQDYDSDDENSSPPEDILAFDAVLERRLLRAATCRSMPRSRQ
jgi:hypothetical protein